MQPQAANLCTVAASSNHLQRGQHAAALVIVHAAAPEAVKAHFGLEGRCRPQRRRVLGGLHIVVAWGQ